MLFVEHLGRSHPEQTVRIVEVERAGDTENHLTRGCQNWINIQTQYSFSYMKGSTLKVYKRLGFRMFWVHSDCSLSLLLAINILITFSYTYNDFLYNAFVIFVFKCLYGLYIVCMLDIIILCTIWTTWFEESFMSKYECLRVNPNSLSYPFTLSLARSRERKG